MTKSSFTYTYSQSETPHSYIPSQSWSDSNPDWIPTNTSAVTGFTEPRKEIIPFFTGSVVYVSTSGGEDIDLCGSESIPCLTIHHGITHFNNNEEKTLYITGTPSTNARLTLTGTAVQPKK
jgi:S-methylmethionine-dependent homocysteine/selenocysteine methylase